MCREIENNSELLHSQKFISIALHASMFRLLMWEPEIMQILIPKKRQSNKKLLLEKVKFKC